jgi:hypothetical protein
MKSPGAISNSRRLARKGEAQGCAEYEIAGSDFKQLERFSNADRRRPRVFQQTSTTTMAPPAVR